MAVRIDLRKVGNGHYAARVTFDTPGGRLVVLTGSAHVQGQSVGGDEEASPRGRALSRALEQAEALAESPLGDLLPAPAKLGIKTALRLRELHQARDAGDQQAASILERLDRNDPLIRKGMAVMGMYNG